MESNKNEKILESQMLVRFSDCDPFNHLNNSRYIDYIINAREDQLLKYYEFDIYKMAKDLGCIAEYDQLFFGCRTYGEGYHSDKTTFCNKQKSVC
jgi:acyl-CoA thioester hydrolase